MSMPTSMKPGASTTSEKPKTLIWITAAVIAVAVILVSVAIALHLRQQPVAAAVVGQDPASLAQRMRTNPNSITDADRAYIRSLPPAQRAQFLGQLSGETPAGAPSVR